MMPLHDSRLAVWLDAYAVDEQSMAEAYEAAGDSQRAAVKTTVARLYQVWGEYQPQRTATRYARHGFALEKDESAAPYAVILCDAACAWAAAFAAALMPAVLAGVEQIIPCFSPISGPAALPLPAVSAAAELVGMERIYAAPLDALPELLSLAAGASQRGRLVLLGPPGFGLQALVRAHELAIPCSSLVFTEQSVQPPWLERDESHRSLWFWPDLHPSWFRNTCMRFSSTAE